MSQLRVGAPDAWACPAENVGLPEAGGDTAAAQLEQALAKFCATYYGSLVSAIGRTANRVHLLIETVNTYKARLEAAQLMSHQEISKLASDFRTQLMGYLMPTFVDSDRLEDCQLLMATVLRAGREVALPLPHQAPPTQAPPPPLPGAQPALPRRASEGALDNLQRDLQHVANWVSAHQLAYSQLGDNEENFEKKTKKVLKMKEISKWESYKRLEEEMSVTSGEAEPSKAATSAKTSNSTDYLTPEPSPSSLSGSDTDQPPYSTTFVLAPIDKPDETPASSADGISRAVAAVEAGASLQVSGAEGTQAAYGAIGISQDVMSPLDSKGSDKFKTTECQTPAMAVTDGLQSIPPPPVGTSGEDPEPAPGEDVERAAVPAGASGQDEPAARTANGSHPAPAPSEPAPSRNWVRAALASVVNAMKAARPSVAASAPDSPAYSLAAPAASDVTPANGNGSGDANGTDGSAISGLKAPSVRVWRISRFSSAREALEELHRQHGILRSALLRHSNRLWLEVRGAPPVRRPPADARLALLSRFRRSLHDVELELVDAQRHLERRADCVAAIGREFWAGKPLPAAAAAAVQAGDGSEASVAPDVGGGLHPQLPPPPPETAPPPPAAPAAPGNGELSCGRVLRLLWSCFTCLPRRQ